MGRIFKIGTMLCLLCSFPPPLFSSSLVVLSGGQWPDSEFAIRKIFEIGVWQEHCRGQSESTTASRYTFVSRSNVSSFEDSERLAAQEVGGDPDVIAWGRVYSIPGSYFLVQTYLSVPLVGNLDWEFAIENKMIRAPVLSPAIDLGAILVSASQVEEEVARAFEGNIDLITFGRPVCREGKLVYESRSGSKFHSMVVNPTMFSPGSSKVVASVWAVLEGDWKGARGLLADLQSEDFDAFSLYLAAKRLLGRAQILLGESAGLTTLLKVREENHLSVMSTRMVVLSLFDEARSQDQDGLRNAARETLGQAKKFLEEDRGTFPRSFYSEASSVAASLATSLATSHNLNQGKSAGSCCADCGGFVVCGGKIRGCGNSCSE